MAPSAVIQKNREPRVSSIREAKGPPPPTVSQASIGKEKPRSAPQPLVKQPSQQSYNKKLPRRSSKPIINWLQRKLAGTVKTRRVVSDGSPALFGVADGKHPRNRTRNGAFVSPSPRPSNRSVSSPLPQIRVPSQRSGAHSSNKSQPRLDAFLHNQRRIVPINDDGDTEDALINSDDGYDLDTSTHRSSMWSPTSALEADEDASLRPLPPSTPPSPSPSLSSSSYLSDPRTFRSIAASTKPTTVLSIDLAPAGIGHIAQFPTTPPSFTSSRHSPHGRSNSTGTASGQIGSGASITFSALPPSPESSSRPPSLSNNNNAGLSGRGPGSGALITSIQAPLHTAHHPRNNPRPSSPPLDNASVLTLASSAYAIPGARLYLGSSGSTALTALGGGESTYHSGASTLGDVEGENSSHFLLDDDRLDGEGDREVDASVRALRPRSSRRNSWESELSGWSARILSQGGGLSIGTKSFWTANSIRTGGPMTLETGGAESADAAEDDLERRSQSSERDLESRSVSDSISRGDEEESNTSMIDTEEKGTPGVVDPISEEALPAPESRFATSVDAVVSRDAQAEAWSDHVDHSSSDMTLAVEAHLSNNLTTPKDGD